LFEKLGVSLGVLKLEEEVFHPLLKLGVSFRKFVFEMN
jgi:hypothetical protein